MMKSRFSSAGIAAAVLVALTLSTVSLGSQERPPLAGGGAHRIFQIMIQEKERRPEGSPEFILRVGERLPLRVVAAWKIPYVGDVTDHAALRVSNPKLAGVDANAVLIARRPGRVIVQATLRVADDGNADKVLEPAEPAASRAVHTFTDRVAVTITK
jgi:hypothetical protein